VSIDVCAVRLHLVTLGGAVKWGCGAADSGHTQTGLLQFSAASQLLVMLMLAQRELCIV
jgi:hypothetical protein